jgi:hypothetical protein
MSVLETIIAGTTGLVGVGLGAWLLKRRERRRGQLDFVGLKAHTVSLQKVA